MLPIIDYGGIALVIPKITAVGDVIDNEKNYAFEVFMDGMSEPFMIGFTESEEAEETRDELIALIAQYHYMKEFGPDFDMDEFLNNICEDEDKH